MVTNIVAAKSTKKHNPVSGFINLVIWSLVVALLCGGVFQYYLTSQLSGLLRFVLLLLSFIVSAGLFTRTTQGQQFLTLWQQSLQEMRQVVWPTRNEALQTAGLVILMVSIMALVLWLIDTGLLWLVAKITGIK